VKVTTTAIAADTHNHLSDTFTAISPANRGPLAGEKFCRILAEVATGADNRNFVHELHASSSRPDFSFVVAA
jgi:hypothetical protein